MKHSTFDVDSNGSTRESQLDGHDAHQPSSRDTGDPTPANDCGADLGVDEIEGCRDPAELARVLAKLDAIRPKRIRARPAQTFWPGITPPYPGADVVKPAEVPGPPTIKPGISNERKFWAIAKTWQYAIEALYGVRDRTFAPLFNFRLPNGRLDISRSKFYKKIIALADKLIEHEVPPAAWFAFRCDQWRDINEQNFDHSKAHRPPPAAWAFRHEPVDGNIQWFWYKSSDYGGGRLRFGNEARELVRDYQAMQRELRKLPEDVSEEQVKEVVLEFFPPGQFNRRVRKAQQEHRAMQVDLNCFVLRGDFAWADQPWAR